MRRLRDVCLMGVLMVAGCMQVVAQGIVVKTKDGSCVNIPAQQLESLTPKVLSSNQYGSKTGMGFVVTTSDGWELRVDSASLLKVESYDDTCELGDTVAGSMPVFMSVGEHTYTVADLTYCRLPDMLIPRSAHQLVSVGDDLLAVGGHTTGFELTATAEILKDGKWESVPIDTPHDDGFSVVMPDGRVMVGDGYASAGGNGWIRITDIYDPLSGTFTAGPSTRMSRARTNALTVGDRIYVSGDWHYQMPEGVLYPPLDVCIDGVFTVKGGLEQRSRPYLILADGGDIIEFSRYNYDGEPMGKDAQGNLLVDRYEPSTNMMYYQKVSMLNAWTPLELTPDVHSADYTDASEHKSFILIDNKEGEYSLMILKTSSIGGQTERYVVPGIYPPTGAKIQYRGGAFVNAAKQEAYFIGSSQSGSEFTLYLITFDYALLHNSFSIGHAGTFSADPATASWCMLPDGRLACTGGNSGDEAATQSGAYVFVPLGSQTSDIGKVQSGARKMAPAASELTPTRETPVVEVLEEKCQKP